MREREKETHTERERERDLKNIIRVQILKMAVVNETSKS